MIYRQLGHGAMDLPELERRLNIGGLARVARVSTSHESTIHISTCINKPLFLGYKNSG